MQLKSRISQWSIVLLALLLALATFSLAWPRMKASYRFLPVELAIERYYDDREIPSHRMLTLIGFAQQALAWHDHYRYHDGLSLLHYLRGMDIETPALERRQEYRKAEAEAVESLQRAPAQPDVWQRIAMVRSILHDEPGTIIAPWRMSIFTGRTHSTLLVPRSGLVLPLLEFLDDESRAMLRDQMLLAWALKPGDLLRTLTRVDPDLVKTRALIGASAPGVLGEMEARIEKAR